MKISIKTKISILYSLVFIAVILLTGIYIYWSVNNFLIQSVLNNIIVSIESNNKIFYQDSKVNSIEESMRKYSTYIMNNNGRRTGMTALLYDSEGRLLEKSGEVDIKLLYSYNQRLISPSLNKGNSYIIKDNLLCFSVPIKSSNTILGTFVYIYDLSEEYKTLSFLKSSFELAGAISILIIILISLYLSAFLTGPLKKLTRAAAKFSDGETVRIETRSKDELGLLVNAFNSMSLSVKNHIEELNKEKSKLNTVLSGLIEGVAAFDLKRDVVFKNEAFDRMADSDLLTSIKGMLDNKEQSSLSVKEINHNRRIYKILSVPMDNLYIVVLRDITMDREITENQKKFVANASHELKTPVTAILGYGQYMKETKEYDEKVADSIISQSNRLKTLVLELLELSKLDDYNYKLEVKTVNISDLVKNIIKNMQQKAEKYNIRICSRVQKDVTVLLDPDKITQVFVNLIDNSIKYSKPGTSIMIKLSKEEKNVVCAIEDKGIGIPGEDIHKIFDRFYRCRNGLFAGGSGLGLSIAKEVVEKHNGTLNVESELNKGTKFTLTIPIENSL